MVLYKISFSCLIEMVENEHWIFQARNHLIKGTLEQIKTEQPPHKVYSDAFYAVASLGLHMKARNAGLFDKQAWQKKEEIGRNIRSLEAFLWKEVR